MERARRGLPTDRELEILKVLWDHGPSTVRAVMEVLARRRPATYTTVLKMLQIMTEKGMVVRDEQRRAHVYRSRGKQHTVLGKLVEDVADRVFDGSLVALVRCALVCQKEPDPAELAAIRRNLKKMREANGGAGP